MPINTKSMVTFMLRALGYEAAWGPNDNIMSRAKEMGLLEGIASGESDNIIRGEVFTL